MVVERQRETQLWQDARGGAFVGRPVFHVVCVRLCGMLERAAAELIGTGLQRELDRGGRVHMFWDLHELVAYDSQIRVRCTELLLRNRASCDSLHAITRSKLVAMGVSVASLALGGIIRVHDDMSSFNAALNDKLNNP